MGMMDVVRCYDSVYRSVRVCHARSCVGAHAFVCHDSLRMGCRQQTDASLRRTFIPVALPGTLVGMSRGGLTFRRRILPCVLSMYDNMNYF